MSTPRSLVVPPGTQSLSWAVRGRHRQVLVNRPIGARDWVVIVPGFTGSKEDFLSLMEPLGRLGLATVVFDQLGQYESAHAESAEEYALEFLGSDLCEVLAQARSVLALPTAGHVLGHSFGGLVVQAAAALGSFDVASATLLCSGPAALPPDRQPPLPVLIDALPDTSLAVLWEAKCAWEQARGEPQPPAFIEEFCRRRWLANDPIGLREMARILCSAPPLVDALAGRARAGLQVQVMWGVADDAWPVETQRAMAAALGATTAALPECGHSPNVDDPELLARLLSSALLGPSSGIAEV